MKFTKKSKIRIRKIILFSRVFFISVFGICLLLIIMSVSGSTPIFPLICFIIGMIAFCIAYALDYIISMTK